ncbi:glycosyltransferase family 2 protein [Glaciimonas soli]|uniref:Glycosyltransferase n=1 Tax=Glaciimonas soli TaxID=2590999 RepID=A0A843YPA8_9BURK|nr:glycosyltransferase family 2 protein [Glaciimonas soli]MQR01325.1 glycosyltransferase [Glaciimonas soli]
MNSVAAIIICFNPDCNCLLNLIRAIDSEVELIIIINNGGLSNEDIKSLKAGSDKLNVVCNDENLGVATALNIGCGVANEGDYRFAVSFDQDSAPEKGMITTLLNELVEYKNTDCKAVAIGPQIVDMRGNDIVYMPFIKFSNFQIKKWYGEEKKETQPVSHVITSGCLLDVGIWSKNMKFDNRLFIDLVDTNWCWNAIRHNYVVLGTTKAHMVHELSEKITKISKFSLSSYSPIRRYYQLRNSIYQIFHEPLMISQRIYLFKTILNGIFSSIFSDKFPLKSLRYGMRGLVDGCIGKLGKNKL